MFLASTFFGDYPKYEIYDFSYTTSEYKALENKKFQMLFVEYVPKYFNFL